MQRFFHAFLLAAATCFALAATAEESPLFDAPRLSGISVDGDSHDWKDSGFRVGMLSSGDAPMPPVSDLNADFRLGWDEEGLLLLLAVQDDVATETPNAANLWENDSVELFVATRRGSSQYYQVVLSPGLDPKFPELRKSLSDWRKDRSEPKELAIQAARVRTSDGYVLEVRFPWKNLAISPESGEEIGFQIYVNDQDGSSSRLQTIWYPRAGTHNDSTAMHRIRLADTPSPPILASATGSYERFRRVKVRILAVGELTGKTVELWDGQETRSPLASGVLTEDAGRASATLTLPMPQRGEAYGTLAALLDGKPMATVQLPNPDEQRARAFMEVELHAKPAVFSGTKFPECAFENPEYVEALIGPFFVTTTYYDAGYNLVTSAEKPGRYGAVIEIVPDEGTPKRRFRTLFRVPEPFEWWLVDVPVTAELPQQLGIDPAVVKEQSDSMRGFLKWRFVDGMYRDDGAAALLAGLHETKAGSPKARSSDDVWARDRQWWVGLKRKLYETETAEPFVCPRLNEGEPATTLHEGSLEAAGMKPDAVEKIDAICRAWAENSDEGFAVCVVRHGVVVLHRAYGNRDGKPMTVDTPSWMASITKLLGGTLMMELVDQGLVGLDDQVDEYVPALRNIEVSTPLTIRHLYTHTNGLWGHWGDDLHDFEEIVADYYPYLQVGKFHSYNGAGYALAGKVIEAVTGEAIPQFFRNHLLAPLGCDHTSVTNMSSDSVSVPMDIAKIGQTLLNRGAYGNLRFFSEETFEQMLPVKLTALLGPETTIEWGIGATWYQEPGFGKGTFGHGAASAATLRIDPANDLVVVMTRKAAGKNFGEYHPKFLAAITESLVSPVSAR